MQARRLVFSRFRLASATGNGYDSLVPLRGLGRAVGFGPRILGPVALVYPFGAALHFFLRQVCAGVHKVGRKAGSALVRGVLCPGPALFYALTPRNRLAIPRKTC